MTLFRAASRAFTLIELLVVVAIIAIVAAIAVPNFLEAQARAKSSRAKNDMRVLAGAVTAYFVDNNHWPPDNFAGQHLDIESYRFFTSPIAYITSIPSNPFSERNPPAARRVPDYEYYLGALDSAGRQAYDDGAGDGGVYTRFASAGPDGVSNVAADWRNSFSPRAVAERTALFVNVVYDPTNGTISSGDIVASNRGLEPR